MVNGGVTVLIIESCGEVFVATEDGSAGVKGNVLDVIRGEGLTADVMYACGPAPMLRALKEYAREQGKIISYDPNYRPPLWEDAETAREQMLRGLRLADVVKVSGEELQLLSGAAGLEEGSARLAGYGPSLILVSLGEKGAFYRLGQLTGRQPTFQVNTIDTNGAGDSFFGAVLHRLSGKSLADIRAMGREELEDILSFANAAGSITTTRKGSIPALPTLEEIEECRRTVPLFPL